MAVDSTTEMHYRAFALDKVTFLMKDEINAFKFEERFFDLTEKVYNYVITGEAPVEKKHK